MNRRKVRQRQRPAANSRPQKQAETFSGVVRDLNSQGLGVVARDDGRVFFVAGVWPDEAGLFEVTGTRGRIGFARALRLDTVSPDRVEAPCAHHGFSPAHCGGCPWQFISYAAQLRAKESRVAANLAGLCKDHGIAPIWGSEKTLGYRNRAQLKSDGQRLGYMAAGSRQIVDIQDCPILNEHNRATLRTLRERLPAREWRTRDRRGWTTLHIDDDVDAATVEPEQRRPFRQGNEAQNERMVTWLEEQLAASGERPGAVELFAGSGNFTRTLARHCSSVLAVDSFAPAVEQLGALQLQGVTARCVDLARREDISGLRRQVEGASLLLLDPPRDGFPKAKAFLEAATGGKTVLYISCDPATCRRDLEVFATKGFKLESVQPVDLYPQTPHVEMLTVLKR